MAAQSYTQGTASYTIKVEDQNLPLTVQIRSISVQNEVNKIPTAHIIILDGDPSQRVFEVGNSDWCVPGKTIEIFAGQTGHETSIFKGMVVKHGIELRSSGMTRLNLMCKDFYVKTTIAPVRRYLIDTKDSVAIETILQPYAGLEIQTSETSTVHPELIQYDTTDWDFVVMRAEANGMICVVENGKMTVAKPNLAQDSILNMVYGSDILDIEAQMDARQQFKTLKTQMWDWADQAPVEALATEPTLDLGGNLKGQAMAFELPTGVVWNHGGKLELGELQALADAALFKQRMSVIKGRVRIFGNTSIKPNTIINLQGLSERFNGKAWVSAVLHKIEDGVWTSDIQLGWSMRWFAQDNLLSQQAPPPLVPPIEGLQIGVVTALEGDPEGEGRILVRMPMISATVEGAWARIVSLDAGAERGFHFKPEIGDEVIVGFLQNDPRKAVVLGGVHSSNKPSPLTNTDSNHLKGYVSRSKMQWMFDDETKSITLKTEAGNEIIISESQKQILIKDQNNNKITMSPDGIVIESSKDLTLKAAANVKIEGINIENKASAQYKAEATASVDISSSGTAILKGNPVLIN